MKYSEQELIEIFTKLPNQPSRVLRYLEIFGSITPLESWRDLSIYRLSAAIHIIRHKYKIPIKTTRVITTTRFGIKANFARYTIEEIKE